MKWLVTLAKGTDPERVLAKLQKLGYTVPPGQRPIPFAGGDLVVQIEGSSKLPQEAKRIAGVVRVNPSSEMTPY